MTFSTAVTLNFDHYGVRDVTGKSPLSSKRRENCVSIKKNRVEGYVVGRVHKALAIRFASFLNTNWAWYESKRCMGVSVRGETVSHLLHLFYSFWLLGIWLNGAVNVWSHFIEQIFCVRASLFILPACFPSLPTK